LLVPDRVFSPWIKIHGEEDFIVLYNDRDNCAKLSFYHDETKLYLEDVTDIHLVIDKNVYINNIYGFFDIDTSSGTVFFVLKRHLKSLLPKGKLKAQVILFTRKHTYGCVWSDNLKIEIR
jgi:hypothetical protein